MYGRLGEPTLDSFGVGEMECRDSWSWNWRDPPWRLEVKVGQKVASINLRVKGSNAKRESEQGIVPL